MKQIFDSDMKYALDAVEGIEAIAEDMKNAGALNIAFALKGEVMKIKSVLQGAIE